VDFRDWAGGCRDWVANPVSRDWEARRSGDFLARA
jgi:hypothetical protein